jgi:hypothetical protein
MQNEDDLSECNSSAVGAIAADEKIKVKNKGRASMHLIKNL